MYKLCKLNYFDIDFRTIMHVENFLKLLNLYGYILFY